MKRQGSIWRISKQLSIRLIISLALLLIAVNSWAEAEIKWPFCVGDVAFDIFENMRVTSEQGAMGQLASIGKMDHSSFNANIYYGLVNLSPYMPPENMPSTKIDLGEIVASMSCITTQDGLKSCHVTYDIVDNSEKIIVFSYSYLSEDDSMIADTIWKSARIDEGCQIKQ